MYVESVLVVQPAPGKRNTLGVGADAYSHPFVLDQPSAVGPPAHCNALSSPASQSKWSPIAMENVGRRVEDRESLGSKPSSAVIKSGCRIDWRNQRGGRWAQAGECSSRSAQPLRYNSFFPRPSRSMGCVEPAAHTAHA